MKYMSALNKIYIGVTISLILTILVSCSASEAPQASSSSSVGDLIYHSTLSASVVTTDLPDEIGVGWRGGFVKPESLNMSPFSRPQTEEIRLAVGEELSTYLIVSGNLDKSMSVLITVLVDYHQVSFELDGSVGVLHKLVLPPKTELNVPMSLDIDQPDAHDLLVIAFADPDCHPADAETRLLQLQHTFAGRRAVVVVNDDNTPFNKLPPDMYGEPIPKSNSDYLGVIFATLPDGQANIPGSLPLTYPPKTDPTPVLVLGQNGKYLRQNRSL